jgi:hypothetical protein
MLPALGDGPCECEIAEAVGTDPIVWAAKMLLDSLERSIKSGGSLPFVQEFYDLEEAVAVAEMREPRDFVAHLKAK